jgi:asparagine synthase (glutamine-hydrolysing)
MCGITGYVGKGDRDILKKMNDTLRYRGPDDEGFYIDGEVGLGHRRLSIIDLSPGGHQPMGNEDGTVTVVFNGEIYNFLELKKLLKKAHVFKGQSDTEIIVHLYEEIGEEVFSKLQGMFAIALYDKQARKLLLARDRMGKKPLFWSLQNGTLLFGSELKALIEHPAFLKKLDLESLNKYFLYEYVPTPHTMFENTYKLEPGHLLKFQNGAVEKSKFWDIAFHDYKGSFEGAKKDLDAALDCATKDRLVADVPLGIFLSGGIDSSAVAYYAQKNSNKKIKTFSIGFKEASFDESAYARKVAAHLGTEHHERILSAKDSLEIIPKIGELLDEPMADASILPTFLLSQFTRLHVTVALGGDGGDELFCGYDTFTAHKLAEYYEKLPKIVRRGILKAGSMLPASSSNMSLDFKIKKFTSGFEGPKEYRNQRWLGTFTKEERTKLFGSTIAKKIRDYNEFDDIERHIRSVNDKDFYHELAYLYERMYMMDQILVKVDRASMWNSLEVRAPFLDTRVVDLANNLPLQYKFKGFERKYVLKKLLEGKLPDDIIYRKKKGFGIPLAEWLRGDLKPLVSELLGNNFVSRQGIFNHDYIASVVEEHMSGKKDNRKQLWTLLVFQMWWEKWCK